VGEFLGRSHYKVFHTTGTAGHARRRRRGRPLLRPRPEQMLNAFGSAGTQSAGLWEFLREAADSKQLHTAHAAGAGLAAAYLAGTAHGRQPHPRRRQGLAAGMSRDADPSRLTDRLGTRWALAETSFKFHAACRTRIRRPMRCSSSCSSTLWQRRTSNASRARAPRARSTCSDRLSIRRPCTRPSSRSARARLIAVHAAPARRIRSPLQRPAVIAFRHKSRCASIRRSTPRTRRAGSARSWLRSRTAGGSKAASTHPRRSRQHAEPARARRQGATPGALPRRASEDEMRAIIARIWNLAEIGRVTTFLTPYNRMSRSNDVERTHHSLSSCSRMWQCHT